MSESAKFKQSDNCANLLYLASHQPTNRPTNPTMLTNRHLVLERRNSHLENFEVHDQDEGLDCQAEHLQERVETEVILHEMLLGFSIRESSNGM